MSGIFNIKSGDIFQLGDHRLTCGDARNPNHVARLFGTDRASMLFTSPPYRLQRTYDGHMGDWPTLMRLAFACVPLTYKAQVMVNLGPIRRDNEYHEYWGDWVAWMRLRGWRLFDKYPWDQGFGLPGHWSGRLAPSHEFVLHFNRVARTPHKIIPKKPENIGRVRSTSIMRYPNGDLKPKQSNLASSDATHKIPDSVIRINRSNGRLPHPAMFPVAFPQLFIEAFTNRREIIYEPFAGSGSTIIAAERTDRVCYAMEINPSYCEIARQRFFMG
jgi:DNA modification methylase